MIPARQTALEHDLGTRPGDAFQEHKISDIFAEYVFDLATMKRYVSEASHQAVKAASQDNRKVDLQSAEDIARGMIQWAMDHGVTHYTHWFQPLTGLTAEKHDAFFKPSMNPELDGIEKLTAGELVQREPDASSFPSGGLRTTWQARGYTVWDPTSPAYILEIDRGRTLYIPSVFISYNGEALDYKSPLLRSVDVLDRNATRVARFFDPTVRHVTPKLGWEQEYFVLDEKMFTARPDLLLCGRTLFGRRPAKGQEKNDHYFGTITERVQLFMKTFEQEAHRLGIPIQTRHNEVAPGQYECAPMFEDLNAAVDHNLLVMIIIEKVARRHGLRVLFHEKPYAELNGSGKHCNWSIATDAGQNLFDPGPNPANNLPFLTFFINALAAIEQFPGVLRASIATSGNDHRLGANEAPPAIMSVFTGSFLETVLGNFREHGMDNPEGAPNPILEMSIPKIPEAKLDNTDRNRTSPFPFTGNKFELRAVGASQNVSLPMTFLNTMVADQLGRFADAVEARMERETLEQEAAIVAELQALLAQSEGIVFNGDGYSEAWAQEAARRGLPNIRTTPEAVSALRQPKVQALFQRTGVLSETELQARANVLLDNYTAELSTEAQLMEELSQTHILPAAVAYQQRLTDLLDKYDELELDDAAAGLRELVNKVAGHMRALQAGVRQLQEARADANAAGDLQARARQYAEAVKPAFEQIRMASDALEGLVEDGLWPLPKYREMLFVR